MKEEFAYMLSEDLVRSRVSKDMNIVTRHTDAIMGVFC